MKEKFSFNSNTNVNIIDKIQFVFHKIILGLIGWLVISWTMLCNVKSNQNYVYYTIIGLGSFVVYAWFMLTTNKKSKWTPFGTRSKSIEFIIIISTIILLYLAFGKARIFS